MAAVMTAQEFVDKLIDIATNYRTLYVMGCFGAPLHGQKNNDRYLKNHNYNKKPERQKFIKACLGGEPTFGFDCVCLIKGVLWGWTGNPDKTYGGASYAVNGVMDASANGMANLCVGGLSKDWSKIEVGEALWMDGHIGVYIGNGLGVECTPAWANNVQITAVKGIGEKEGYKTRKWTSHGKLPYIQYGDYVPQPPVEPPVKTGEQKPSDATIDKSQSIINDVLNNQPPKTEDPPKIEDNKPNITVEVPKVVEPVIHPIIYVNMSDYVPSGSNEEKVNEPKKELIDTYADFQREFISYIITEYQQWLNGTFNTSCTIGGVYDDGAKKATLRALHIVTRQLTASNLEITDEYDDQLKLALQRIPLKSGYRGDIVKILQGILYGLGFNPNGLTGLYSKGTVGIVKTFQELHGLDATGIMNIDTWNLLFT